MPIPINAPPETLADDLTMSLWRERATLRLLARRKAWEPSIDDCRDMVRRMLEYLKRRGVLRVIREGASENQWPVVLSWMTPEMAAARGPS